MFVWGNADITVSKSYYKRAGGPLIIMNHVDPEEENDNIPQITITEDCAMESKVTGQETWFATVGGTAIITQLQALDEALFKNTGKTIYKDGKLNIIALLMRDATNAEETLKAYQVQGRVSWAGKNAELNRMNDNTSLIGAATSQILGMVHQQTGGQSPGITFNVGNQEVFWTDGTNVLDTTTAKGQEVYMRLIEDAQTSDYISLNLGGIGLLLGFVAR